MHNSDKKCCTWKRLNNYSLLSDRDFDFENDFDKQQLYEQFVTYNCKDCSSAALIYYAYNKIFQELTTEDNYLKDSDEKIYIDLRRSKGYTNKLQKITRNDNKLSVTINKKTPAIKKVRLKVTGYSQGKYSYVLSQTGLTVICKIYTIKKDNS